MQGVLRKKQFKASLVEHLKENHENTIYVYMSTLQW